MVETRPLTLALCASGVVAIVAAVIRAWPRLRLAIIRREAFPDGLREFAAATLGQGGVIKMLGYYTLLPLVNLRLPRPIVTWLCRRVGAQQGIDFSELEQPVSVYPTLDAFFVRGLDPSRRPICRDPDAVVSPADAEILDHGPIVSDTLMHAKGVPYRLGDLLPVAEAARFADGDYIVLYLRPSDCHRVFCPVDHAHVRSAVAIGGGEMPVAPVLHELLPGIYVQNKRLAHLLSSPGGDLALVMVGAFKVGRMEATYDPRPWARLATGRSERRDYESSVPLDRGTWMATFHLGSSIILLFESGQFQPDAGLIGRRIRYGERLGLLRPAA